MDAAQIIDTIQDAGGTIEPQGGRLRIVAPKKVRDALRPELKAHKPEILVLLGWDTTDWQQFFDERAGILEFDGELPRAEAETQAWEWTITEWLNQNPAPSDEGRCAWCDKSEETVTGIVVPLGNDAHGHVWLHHQCWKPWMQKRREDAISALATTGIRVHEKNDRLPSNFKNGEEK